MFYARIGCSKSEYGVLKIKLDFQFKITVWRYVVMSGHASAFGVINFPPNIQEVRVSIIDVRQGAY